MGLPYPGPIVRSGTTAPEKLVGLLPALGRGREAAAKHRMNHWQAQGSCLEAVGARSLLASETVPGRPA